jgi:dihydroorotase
MPGVETSLPLMLTHAANGKCTVSDVARWMCEGPAKVYGMAGKGRLEEGFDGDLALVDMENSRTISDSDTWTTVGWTPLAGMELTGFAKMTVVGGIPVHGRTTGASLRGEPLCQPSGAGKVLKFI